MQCAKAIESHVLASKVSNIFGLPTSEILKITDGWFHFNMGSVK